MTLSEVSSLFEHVYGNDSTKRILAFEEFMRVIRSPIAAGMR